MTDRAMRLIKESIAALQMLGPGPASLEEFWRTIGGVEARLWMIEEELTPKDVVGPQTRSDGSRFIKDAGLYTGQGEALARDHNGYGSVKGLRADDIPEGDRERVMRKL